MTLGWIRTRHAEPLGDRLRSRIPELLLLGLGIALRLSVLRSLSPDSGYDFGDHWEYVEWLARQWTLPPADAIRGGAYPPLFYVLSGQLVRWGAGPDGIQMLSVAAGCLRLVLIWIGLEMAMPRMRLARLAALAIAAVVPASVHIDGMVTAESLGGLLVVIALLLAFQVFRSGRRRGMIFGAAAGLALGLAVLTRVSSLTVVIAIAMVVLVRFVLDASGGWRGRVRRLEPWLLGLAVFGLTSGWYLARNQALYGKPLLTPFDTHGRRFMVAIDTMPIIFRRPMEFVVGWNDEIYASPFYPSASLANARFFPMLVASTFADYYNFGFAPHRPGTPSVQINERAMPASVLPLARASAAGGTLIAAVTALAWVASCVATWRRRAYGDLLLLAVPLMALAGLLYFSVVYPHDWLGVVKGAYLQFAAAPLYGLFGVGVAWLASRRRFGVLAILPLGALGMVAAYTVYCRFS